MIGVSEFDDINHCGLWDGGVLSKVNAGRDGCHGSLMVYFLIWQGNILHR
jgi:hypothetical protein